MDGELRPTGLDILGDAPWGTHVCQFYQTAADLTDILVPYFKAGLESNEFCMWVTHEPLTRDGAIEAMRGAMPDFDSYLDDGLIEIVRHDEWYLEDGEFDLNRVFDGWIGKLDAALGRGLEGLRATGNTAWLEPGPDFDDFTEYEEALNDIIGDYRIMAMCTYRLDRCGANEIIDVVSNHQYALVKREGSWSLIESSERKKVAEELRRTAEKLQMVNQELEGYAHIVSHDLRGPLTSIMLSCKFLEEASLEEPGLDGLRAEVSENVRMVTRNVAKSYALIDGLLALAEAGQVPYKVEEIDITDTVQRIIEESSPDFRRRGAGVRVTGELGLVRASPVHMQQLFANLINNGVKHNDSPEPRVEVSFLGVDDDGARRYLVKDNGSGIAEEDMGNIFRPFFKRARTSDTGIGLATVQKIVNVYGGNIRAYNDNGACFEFTINDFEA